MSVFDGGMEELAEERGERIAALEQELRLAKAARDEWMQRWQFAEERLTRVWDDAILEARMRLGRHEPRCEAPMCSRCKFDVELENMLRGDPYNYIPIKERLRENVAHLEKNPYGGDCEYEVTAYRKGLYDMLALVEKMLGELE